MYNLNMSNLVRLVDLIEWNEFPVQAGVFGNTGIVYLYGLLHPFLGTVRYIGITETPARRLQGHVYDSLRGKHGNRDLQDWICDLVEAGRYPRMVILKTLHPGNCRTVEQAYIKTYADTVLNRDVR